MKKNRDIDFDEVLEELGEMGTSQIITYILVCLPVLFSGANSLSYVFTVGIPEYRCLIPECEDPSNTSYNEPWVEWAIPKPEVSNQVIGVNAYNCDRYVPKNVSDFSGTCSKQAFSSKIMHCSQWVFDDFERTIVNDLTCLENQWKISLVGTSHFAGIILGSFIFGLLADKYGRKPIFILCIVIMSISGSLQVTSPNYVTFVFFIFVNSLGTAGVYPLAFILGVEMVGKRKRELTGIVLNYFYAIGEAIVSPIAWYSRSWIPTQLIVSVPPIFFLAYYWAIPESVRWLLARNKKSEAEKIVFKVAKKNKVILSSSLTRSFIEKASWDENKEKDDNIFPMIKEIVKSKKIVFRLIIIYFIWGVNAFIYYGLSINSTSLGGNKYINFALVSLIEIPGYTIAWISIGRLGRRLTLVMSLLLCGVTCTLTIFVNTLSSNWLVIILFLMGKLGITSAFGVVYVYTAELIPTIVRSGGVGAASTIARVGALLAPFVPILALYYTHLPMLLFGVVGIIAGLLAIKLPETLGIKLPETVEEAENI